MCLNGARRGLGPQLGGIRVIQAVAGKSACQLANAADGTLGLLVVRLVRASDVQGRTTTEHKIDRILADVLASAVDGELSELKPLLLTEDDESCTYPG